MPRCRALLKSNPKDRCLHDCNQKFCGKHTYSHQRAGRIDKLKKPIAKKAKVAKKDGKKKAKKRTPPKELSEIGSMDISNKDMQEVRATFLQLDPKVIKTLYREVEKKFSFPEMGDNHAIRCEQLARGFTDNLNPDSDNEDNSDDEEREEEGEEGDTSNDEDEEGDSSNDEEEGDSSNDEEEGDSSNDDDDP